MYLHYYTNEQYNQDNNFLQYQQTHKTRGKQAGHDYQNEKLNFTIKKNNKTTSDNQEGQEEKD